MTAEKIALSLNCSRAHLYRAFAQRGEKIGQVIRAARLERASILILTNPAWPIGKVAELCGFTSTSAFIRMFRRQRGLSPAQFRDKAKRSSYGGSDAALPGYETKGM